MAGTAALTALLLVGIGWLTDLCHTFHAVLIGLAVVGLLPFLLVAGGLLMCLLSMVLAGAAGGHGADAGSGLAEGGFRLIVPYYRFLARQRHPVTLGAAIGLPLGVLLLWVLLAVFVLPGEAATVAILAKTKERIEQQSRKTHQFPEASPDGKLLDTALGGQREGAVEDGFGRALHYERSGTGLLAGYRFTSLGFDGEWLRALTELAGKPTLSARLGGIKSMSCIAP